MKLEDLLKDIQPSTVQGSLDVDADQIHFDSRKVTAGSVFVAVAGTQVDGHQFIDKAIQNGAVAIVAERLPELPFPDRVTFVQVPDSAAALGWMASNYYSRPSRQLRLVGVTGTNGKTTVVTLLQELFTELGYKAGLFSTIENRIGRQVFSATHTTPDPVALNRLMADMVDAGCDYAFMEVSSHAVHQKRIAGLHFTGAIFTNISHDHLDYHKTFKAYIQAKKAFFDQLPESAFALTNIDDKRGGVMVQNTRARIYRYSLRQLAEFKAKIIENSLSGLHLEIGKQEFFGRLIGEFNAYNLLAVYAAAVLLDQDAVETLTVLSTIKAAEGRFDYLVDARRQVTGIVDYAHTPDALEKVLSTINRVKGGDGKIIAVVGCGGDRDKAKRPRMAEVACNYSDQVIFTSDNPRSEDPEAIIRDMEKGIPPYATRKTLSITSRAEAIRTACSMAQPGDVVLVAGKGHEKYQEIKGVKYPFDDKEILKEEFSDNNAGSEVK